MHLAIRESQADQSQSYAKRNAKMGQKIMSDPRGRTTVTTGSDHYFHMWCLYVRTSPLFEIKQNNFQVKIVIVTGGTVGLAEWIIEGTYFLSCLILMMEL